MIHLGGGTVTPVVSQALWHHNRSVFLHRWRDELEKRPKLRSTGSDDDMNGSGPGERGPSNARTMSMPTSDSSFVEELVADVDAYLHRLTLLTEFAESQVQERVRLTRAVEQLASDRDGHLQTIADARPGRSLDARLEGSIRRSVRLRCCRRRIWRKIRRHDRDASAPDLHRRPRSAVAIAAARRLARACRPRADRARRQRVDLPTDGRLPVDDAAHRGALRLEHGPPIAVAQRRRVRAGRRRACMS